jgi:hypothetical protein
VGSVRRTLAVVFAGDRRVWRTAAIVVVPIVFLIAFYCVRPRDYYTGTNNVELYSYVVRMQAGQPLCVPGLEIPANTGRIRLQLLSPTGRPTSVRMALVLGSGRTLESVAPVAVQANHAYAAVFSIPVLPSHPSLRRASLCLTSAEVIEWGGTPLAKVPASAPPTAAGHALPARIAVWYLPRAGARHSYL